MFQNTQSNWMSNNPLIYYPFQPNLVSQSIHHQLRIDLPPLVQNRLNFYQKQKIYYLIEKLNRTFYMDTINTSDNQLVLYADLYLDTKVLSTMENRSLVCHILSLYNPIQPHLKPINCYQQIVKYFICEKLIPGKKNIITLNVGTQNERYGLIKCTNGQYISTLYTCDGHQDCSDGTDEVNLYCFRSGKMINNNIYC